MGRLPPWVEIPRTDLAPEGVYRLPIAFRLALGLCALFTLALFVGALWTALYDSPIESRVSMFVVAAIFGLFLACLLPIVARFWDRIETTPEELRCVRPWGEPVAVQWSRVESLRGRPMLQRIEVGSSGLRRPIRLELQLQGIEALLMFVAERTLHLVNPGVSPETRTPRGGVWLIEADGVASPANRINFADVADLRILRLAAGQRLQLAVAAQLRQGSWALLAVGVEGILDLYQRARRAHRDWLVRSGAAAPPPIAELQPQRGFGVRRWLALLIPSATAIALGVVSGVLRNPETWRGADHSEQALIGRSWDLFRTHRYADVVELAEKHFADHDPSPANLPMLHLQAVSFRKLERRDEAIQTYEKGVPVVRTLDSVHAEPYGIFFYELAALYDAAGDIRHAIATLEEGLKLRPGSAMHRALLAAWYQDVGDAEQAQSLFHEVLETVPEGSEPYAVSARRLASGWAVNPRSHLDLEPLAAELTPHMAIAVVPLNDVDSRIDIAGICLVLEAELWIPCGVVKPSRFPEALLLDSKRNQYRATRVLAALHSTEASITRAFREPEGGVFVLGVISHDLYDGDSNFVFSASRSDWGVGVISSYRLLEDLPRYWNPAALAGRRLSIQAISAVGTGLGFERPMGENCPLAYPNGVEAFVLKRGELCASEVRSRDAFLARFGDQRMHHDTVRSAAVTRARHAYLLDRIDVD
jgi:predicted Zn-dependent protease